MPIAKETPRLIEIPVNIREEFAESLMSWLLKVLRYYDVNHWYEKRIDPKRPRTKANLHYIREGMRPVNHFEYRYELLDGLKGRFDFYCLPGPFVTLEEASTHVNQIVNSVSSALEALSETQYRRLREILVGRRSL